MSQTAGEDRILTIPNLVSSLRLLGVGFFWWALVGRDDVALAAWTVVAFGWTDWIDGYLARRLGQVSRLGKTLDPVADRLMIASALIGGLVVGVLPGWLAWGLIVREALVGSTTLVVAARGGGMIEVRYLGKVATFLLYGSIPAFYLAGAGVVEWLLRPAAWISGVIGLVLYWYVAVLYLGDGRSRLAAVESSSHPEEV